MHVSSGLERKARRVVIPVGRQGAALLARPPRVGTVDAELAAVVGCAGGPAGEALPLLPHFRLLLRDDPQQPPGSPLVPDPLPASGIRTRTRVCSPPHLHASTPPCELRIS